jgi:septal ring factor EnvC (AmiA/AmiB activator)
MTCPFPSRAFWLYVALGPGPLCARAEPIAWPSQEQQVGDATLSSADITADMGPEIAGIAAEQVATASELNAVSERLVRDARAWLRLQRSGLTPLAGGMDALLGHASRTGRVQRMIRDDLAAKAVLAARLQDLANRRQRISDDRDKRARDLALIRAAELRADQQAFSASFERDGKAAQPGQRQSPVRMAPSYGLSIRGQGDGQRTTGVLARRGRLAMPVAAAAGITAARRAESDGPGLELQSEHGARIRAVAEGQVAFAGAVGRDGRTVVVDHGDQYFTVYGGFDEIDVEVGDEVSAGARLGTTGTGTAYFEVRRGTRTQDARAWLGI